MRRPMFLRALAIATPILAGCRDEEPTSPARLDPAPVQVSLDPGLVAGGRKIFRFDTFGDETFWTDTLRLHRVIQRAVSPAAALGLGLKVDVAALPSEIRSALRKRTIDLTIPPRL